MALGAGTSRAEQAGHAGEEGFGIVALASLFPVLTVLLLSLGFMVLKPEGEILDLASKSIKTLPLDVWSSLVEAACALLPLACLLRFLLWLAGRSSPPVVQYPDDDEVGFSIVSVPATICTASSLLGLAVYYVGLKAALNLTDPKPNPNRRALIEGWSCSPRARSWCHPPCCLHAHSERPAFPYLLLFHWTPLERSHFSVGGSCS